MTLLLKMKNLKNGNFKKWKKFPLRGPGAKIKT